MSFIFDPAFQMWFVLALTGLVVILYVRETWPIEVISVGLLTCLLLFGQLLPLPDANGNNMMDSVYLLAGFANPSLIAVLALIVMGQGMIHTNALRHVTNLFAASDNKVAWISTIGVFAFVMVASAFLNNTPLVIIAIPLVQSLAVVVGVSESRLMIPLSFVAILGGMTTLIGSSTNLLVSSAMTDLGYKPLEFFDFVIPGSIMAAVGFLYVVIFVPRLLSDRSSMVSAFKGNVKEFIAELDVAVDSKLVGMECERGSFPELSDLNVKLIQRGGHLILPPFEGYTIEAGDILIASATRDSLLDLFAKYPGFLLSENLNETAKGELDEKEVSSAGRRVLAEVMIPPASRMIDMTIEDLSAREKVGTVILGIQRRARVVRRRLGRVRLEAGDVLLIAGSKEDVDSIRENSDFVVLSGSKRDLPVPGKANIAVGIFVSTIIFAATGFLSIPVAAIAGCLTMVATGCLNMRQAMRAIDRKIFLLVGSMLALGAALQATGGARFIAEGMLSLPISDTPLAMAAVLFLVVAFTTNILTNNACAILFTPIALNLAGTVKGDEGLDLVYIFAVTVVFAANCSFASPIGYQTNLLVMGPGHYRFRDFMKSGIPLIFLLWGVYILIAKYYFGL